MRWGLGNIAAIVVLAWPLVGADGWLAYLAYLRESSSSPDHRVTALQTVQSLVEHLLRGGDTPGRPVVELPFAAAHGIAFAVVLVLIGTTLYAARRRPDDDLGVGAAILLTLVALPETLLHAYTLPFIPIALLVRRIGVTPVAPAGDRSDGMGWLRLALWVAAGMIILRVPFLSARLADGWVALFAYPKLYGALVLWVLCIVLQLRTSRQVIVSRTVATPGIR